MNKQSASTAISNQPSDIELLARHLINTWGDYVKVDDMPEDMIVVFALNTLQFAAAELAWYRDALQKIANGNPAPAGKWLSDIEMAEIARAALKGEPK